MQNKLFDCWILALGKVIWMTSNSPHSAVNRTLVAYQEWSKSMMFSQQEA